MTDQVWDGNVHTNESFLFYNNANPTFTGTVNSAGCNDLPINTISLTCTRTPKTYESSVQILPNTGLTTSSGINQNLVTKLNSAGSNPNFNGGVPDFTASYRPFPQSATDQSLAAQGSSPDYPGTQGLYFGSNVTSIQLYTANAAGVLINSGYNATTKTWPVATYQYIRVQNGVTTDLYRINARKQIEKQTNSTGPWVLQPLPFNGVIYSSGSINKLYGPDRLATSLTTLQSSDTASAPYTPPALASFMEMTIAANNTINIESDITLADTPCIPSETACVSSNKPTPKNVLGIYSQSGDITITTGNTPAVSNYNLNIQAMVMASQGQVTVTNYNTSGSYKGKVNLLGGLVENWYGAFGTTSPTGYNRNFSYDRRFNDPNFGPPASPISPIWLIAQPSDDDFRSLNAVDWRQDTQ